jgi:hypothetical protein
VACFSPLHAFKAKSETADKLKIVFRRPDSWRGEALDLPCGQCVGCRLERSRQWAVRCVHEASLYDENSFLTLTYDDEHLPSDGSLHLRDFQLFMKRLRRSIAPKRVRFYHCGEYGESLGRPHYHALLFGHGFSDGKFFSERGGNVVRTSAALSELWPFGFSVVGDVTFESAAYVARYVMKKVTGDRAAEHYSGRKAEYTTMSRRPGIGKAWFDRFKDDVYPLDRLVVRGRDCRPPRFYDSLYSKLDRSSFELIKLEREKSGRRFVEDVLSDGSVIRVSDNDGRRLLVREEVKKAELLQLIRPLEGVS